MSNPQNEGHDGWTISQIAGIATGVVGEYAPNVVTLLIGTNDINLNEDVSDAPARISTLIDQLFSAAPGAAIVVAAIPPTSDQTLQGGLKTFNAAVSLNVLFRRQAGQHIVFVDTNDIDPNTDKADTLHPNDSGYQKLGNDFNGGVQLAMAYGWVPAPVSCSSTAAGCTAGSGPHTPGPIGAAPQPGTSSPMEVASGVGADPTQTRTVFADINGDGKADYVVIDNTTGALTVWLNGGPNTAAQNGWVWVPAGTIASGVAPGAEIHLADLDGDGRADYIIVDPTSGALSVYLNGGQNSAAPNGWVWYPKGQIASGVGPGSTVRFGDINDDGLADYLIVNTKTGAVQAYLNGGANPAAHDGWVWYPQGTVAAGVGAPAGSLIQFVDINNDGYADYLVTDINNGTVHAWLNQGPKSGGGWGWWGQGQIAPGSGAPSRFNLTQMADLDGDGKADYLSIAQNDGEVHVWLNKGKDTTAVSNWLPLGEIASGGIDPVGSIIMKDLDGDGLPDYLQVSDRTGLVSAYLNGGPKPGGGWIWYPQNEVFSIGISAGGNPPTSGVLYRMGDINGDGKVDYVAIIAATGEIYAAINGGKPVSGGYWNWGPLNDITNVGIKLPGSSSPGQSNPQFAPITRLFGDDLILNTNDGNLKIIYNAGGEAGYFGGSSPVALAYATGTGTLINLNDIDGDGAPDYLVTTSTGAVNAWKNDVCQNAGTNSETCTPSWTGLGQITTGVAAPSATTRIAFADIDGNGRADYLVIDTTTGAIKSAWLNNNGGVSGNWDPNK